MAEPDNMVLPLLREMRVENLEEHKRTRAQVTLLEKRMAKLEEMQASYRQALSADTLLSKLVTGEFEERLLALESRMTAVERH
jgi:predicted ATP-binding protein involved in virulence